MDKKGQLNALDLFAGAGGFSEGANKAGINIVAAIEFDSQIAKTYKYNHPDTQIILDDIKNISTKTIYDIFQKKNYHAI